MRRRKHNRYGTPKKPKKQGKRLTRHHCRNKCHGGSDDSWNILMLSSEHHAIWHKLFHNLDIPGVIELLKRVQRLKGQVVYEPDTAPQFKRAVVEKPRADEADAGHQQSSPVAHFGRKPQLARGYRRRA